ncbi:MAG TPA: polyprenol phosphomannose-dependent alpha 1,6 mannosyltransferase MptB [Candidatus Corynebacterium gallistercoris]|uniref:Polyprenol phosphomannose-dependent alpha 1,6 mannosyltransferase MptB n=1 Tax=Candidatus Corynebacterium gallistercoris TaxID=2838530 RepID=A0A9D1URC6_9CORY|nr:polyprenol phosphomannose-dependent alpha 1,6 mannosyltransferase MptB [Candidatus Corynebacterium gallistercoris]
MSGSPTPARRRIFRGLRDQLPHLGQAGSRSAQLHVDSGLPTPTSGVEPLDAAHRLRLSLAMTIGVLGSVLIAIGGLGAGAFPVVHNPYWDVPGVSLLARMLHSTSVAVFIGVGCLVVGWLLLARFCTPGRFRRARYIPTRTTWRIFVLWVVPFAITPPLFTQDIYSYLAQGSIAARGWDPYSAGPVDLLGIDDPLARSVPLMWAHSPAPYGPVALGYGQIISWVTGDSILWGILAHRIVAVLGLALTGWALVRLAQRCGVPPVSALWLGMLNPLAILHLIGGIHNEALMLGLLLAGMELVLRGVDELERPRVSRWLLVVAGFALITCAGLVKVTALIGLGFAGVALARWWGGRWVDLLRAAGVAVVVFVATATSLSLLTGVGMGWIRSQGGAADIVSWMSISTTSGLASALLGSWLGLGDHRDAALALFRGLGLAVGAFWLLRMLWAAFKGRIHPMGALGIATLMLVIFFPVVHPWYLLWAILPLAAWANRRGFHLATVGYSVAFSFFILPRGLGLPPSTVLYIYFMSAAIFALLILAAWRFAKNQPLLQEAIRSETFQRTKLRIRD